MNKWSFGGAGTVPLMANGRIAHNILVGIPWGRK